MIKHWRAIAAGLGGLALATVAVAAGAADFTPEAAQAKWNMPVGVTEISRDVHGLHMLIFWICCAIAVVVFGAMFYSIWAHRRSKHPVPANFHESTTVEIIWTIIPFAILVAMAIPAAATLIKMEDTRGSDLTIKATGIQWLWHYEYLGEDVAFYSRLHPDSDRARRTGSGIDPASVPNYLLEVDNRLVVPVGKKVRLLLTAHDVIHAWWVPALGMKKDAIPGYINEIWFRIDEPGVYRGQCAELCGRDHGFMPIVVEAVGEADYAAWLERMRSGQAGSAAAQPVEVAQAPAATASDAAPAAADGPQAGGGQLDKATLMAKGQQAYMTHCAACHQPNGQGMPPTFPSLVGSAVVTGPAKAQIEQVLKGKGAMPPMGYLSDEEIAAAITYTRNSWGNDAGVVQPADVAAAR